MPDCTDLTAKGGHKTDSVDDLDTGAGNCSRPIDDGQVNCGLFHLVSNLQGFVNVAIHDGTGLMASVMLPDADGTVNQPRMMAAGTNGTAWAQRFNVPSTFSKQARFRTSWTGGLPGWGGGVDSFELGGQTVLTGGATTELGQAWSSWGPTVTGSTDVVWSTTCEDGCMSGSDLFEWRTWETGAARFQTRLRFPGQYADAETDFYENWNRYYDPPTGRYWSPEPMLSLVIGVGTSTSGALARPLGFGAPQPQVEKLVANVLGGPAFLQRFLGDGRSTPSYSYAGNNPVRSFDPDGLQEQEGGSAGRGSGSAGGGPAGAGSDPDPGSGGSCAKPVDGKAVGSVGPPQWPSLKRVLFCVTEGAILQYRCRRTGMSIEKCTEITNRWMHKCFNGGQGPGGGTHGLPN